MLGTHQVTAEGQWESLGQGMGATEARQKVWLSVENPQERSQGVSDLSHATGCPLPPSQFGLKLESLHTQLSAR